MRLKTIIAPTDKPDGHHVRSLSAINEESREICQRKENSFRKPIQGPLNLTEINELRQPILLRSNPTGYLPPRQTDDLVRVSLLNSMVYTKNEAIHKEIQPRHNDDFQISYSNKYDSPRQQIQIVESDSENHNGSEDNEIGSEKVYLDPDSQQVDQSTLETTKTTNLESRGPPPLYTSKSPSRPASVLNTPANYVPSEYTGQSSSMSPLLSPSPYTHKKNKWGLSRLFRRMLGISPSKSKTHPANLLSAQESGTGIHYTATGQAIHIVSNVGTPGEVPTSYEREEILSRIHGASSIGSDTSSSQSVQLETELIASQSQIWVFRENDDSRYGPNVWSVFDYGNQKVLFEHASKILSNMHVEDTLDLYDSHIKHGIIPVMIVPAQNKGYYLSNISTESVAKITINCLDNTPTTRFVFRTDGLTSPFSIV